MPAPVRLALLHDLMRLGVMTVGYVRSAANPSDIFTKPVCALTLRTHPDKGGDPEAFKAIQDPIRTVPPVIPCGLPR